MIAAELLTPPRSPDAAAPTGPTPRPALSGPGFAQVLADQIGGPAGATSTALPTVSSQATALPTPEAALPSLAPTMTELPAPGASAPGLATPTLPVSLPSVPAAPVPATPVPATPAAATPVPSAPGPAACSAEPPPPAAASAEVIAQRAVLANAPVSAAPEIATTPTEPGEAPDQTGAQPALATKSPSTTEPAASAATETPGQPETDPPTEPQTKPSSDSADAATDAETGPEACAAAAPPALPATLPVPPLAAALPPVPPPAAKAEAAASQTDEPSEAGIADSKPRPRAMPGRLADTRPTTDPAPQKAEAAPPFALAHGAERELVSDAPAPAVTPGATVAATPPQAQTAPALPARADALPLDTARPGWEAALTDHITTRLTDIGQEIDITLSPEKLGTLHIRLELSDTVAQVRIVTDNPQAAQLFQQSEHRLSEALNRSGLTLASHDASSRDPGARDGGGNSGSAPRGGPARPDALLAALGPNHALTPLSGRHAVNLVNLVA